MAHDLALYLRLAPEFGGTRFGPFEGAEVRLGCDPGSNDITLPEALGVLRNHVKVLRQSDQNLIVAPVERTGAVFIWQGVNARPKQISAPMAVRPGDSFSLVTAQGPRFIVEIDQLPEQLRVSREEERRKRMMGRLNLEGFKEEGKRQAWVAILTTGIGQLGQRAYTFVTSGAIFQPRNIILLVTMAGGYVFGGVSSCSLKKKISQLEDMTAENKDLSQEVSTLKQLSQKSADELTFEDLVVKVTGNTDLGSALKQDAPLRDAVVKQLAVEMRNAGTAPSKIPDSDALGISAMGSLREDLEKAGVDADLAALLPFLGLAEERSRDGWTLIESDSGGKPSCARGPLALTWRQARNLGLDVYPEAFILNNQRDLYSAGEAAKARVQQEGSETNIQLSPSIWEGALEFEPVEVGGQGACLTVKGAEDDRTDTGDLARAVAKRLVKLKDFDENSAFWGVGKVATLLAMDDRLLDFESPPSIFKPKGQVSDALAERDWVLRRTAAAIGRAVAWRCLATLNGGKEREDLQKLYGGELDAEVDCLILNWKLRDR